MSNALILLQLLMQLTTQATQIAALLNKAHSEGRTVTDAEIDALFADDDVAKAAFQKLIDEAKAAKA